MNQDIKILIADDNIELCELLKGQFQATSDLKVVGCFHNGKDAYDFFLKRKPDVVLLDIVMPYMDGFRFLELINEEDQLGSSKIILISSIQEERFINYGLELGADYYMMKPLDPKQVEYRIRKLFAKQTERTKAKPIAKASVPVVRQVNIHSEIAKMLIDSGLPVHTLGYKYFQCAIQYLLNQNSDVFSITKTIYPYVAIKYETSSSCVDKAMRHSIQLAHQDNGDVLHYFLQQMNYKDSTAKPSNSEFLNLSMEKMRQVIASNQAS